MGYDIIGDIHGHADRLEALLKKLGYAITSGRALPALDGRLPQSNMARGAWML
jgi:hypothetical protein